MKFIFTDKKWFSKSAVFVYIFVQFSSTPTTSPNRSYNSIKRYRFSFVFFLFVWNLVHQFCMSKQSIFVFFKQVSLKICRMSIKKLYEDIWKSEKLEKRFPVQWCRKSWRLWKNYPFLKMTFGHKKKHFFANLRPLILLYC